MTRKHDGPVPDQSLREAWANGHERGQEYVDTGVCRHCEPIGEPEYEADCGEPIVSASSGPSGHEVLEGIGMGACKHPHRNLDGFTLYERTLIGRAVARAIEEVREEIALGRVPRSVPNFSALHDYLDANELGGLCEDAWSDRWASDDRMVDADNAVQDAVCEWITAGWARRVPTDPAIEAGGDPDNERGDYDG